MIKKMQRERLYEMSNRIGDKKEKAGAPPAFSLFCIMDLKLRPPGPSPRTVSQSYSLHGWYPEPSEVLWQR